MENHHPLYIFDLDGTLSIATHRLHFIEHEDKSRKQWREFYEACDQDLPNAPIIHLLDQLRLHEAEIWIFTGRSDVVRDKTEQWLFRHTSLSTREIQAGLHMRCDGDFRHDDELKQAWLQALSLQDRNRLAAVFEDRDRVVQMWRRNGITCLQVANGTF